MRVESRTKTLTAAIITFILSGLVYIQFGKDVERTFFYVFTLLLILGIKTVSFYSNVKLNLVDLCYFLFILAFFLDAVICHSLNPVLNGFAMFLAYYACRIIMFYNFSESYYKWNYRLSMFFATCVYIIAISKYGIYTPFYRGTFGNSNTMGIFAASIATVIVSKCTYLMLSRKNIYIFDFCIYFLSIFLALLSSCRTAIISIILQILFLVFIMKKAHNKKKSLKFKMIMGSALIYDLFISEHSLIYNQFIYKFIHVSQRSDITNHRIDKWKPIWENSGILGNGSKVYDAVSHNIYLGLINMYGKLAGILFFLFVFFTLFSAFSFSIKSNYKGEWKYLPVMSCILFFCVSMTENYLMTYPMILMFISLPMLYLRSNATLHNAYV